MRNKFDEQLEKLHIELIKMGALCEEAVSTAILALEKNDVKILNKVFETDSEIDQAERDIERLLHEAPSSAAARRHRPESYFLGA